ncbi:hypothetical protein FRD00_26130 [Persicimonas caeni]|uniref:hypothetical protein n=1 Tax=Persicimonas caeni TaxID=2292766 RepID=UPI0011BBEA1C|nr:hypothetical protein [Persicimonas caeni]QED35314.1 hypothetical protein FRD00_26130 [Persicimonas caeni]
MLLASATLGLASGCGDDDGGNRSKGIVGEADAGTEDAGTDTALPDADFEAPAVPTSVETVLASTTVSAGTPITVDCQLLDAEGGEVEIPDGVEPTLVYAPEQSFIEESALSLVPTMAGNATVSCQFPDLSLADDTPAELTIEAGAPHTVVTALDTNIVTAGDSATATCDVFDAYGNEVEGADTTVEVDASGAGIAVDDHTVTITKSGVYTVSCTADGASEERGQALEVNPSLPAALAISKVPDLPFYDTGQVVDIATIVTDEYGNQVDDAFVSFVSNPSGETFGHGRFRYNQEGTYTVTATVDGETKDDMTLEQSVDIVVNGQGPSIECVSPTNGAMRDAAPGDTVTFEGRVNDAQGIGEVTVNNSLVTVASDGTFQSDVTVRFGINFVDIRATDAATGEYKEENSTTCAFLTADKWGAEDQHMSDAVSLWVDQDAVDDGNYGDPLDSLNDVLHTVLNSDGLRDQLHQSMLAANPLTEGCVDVLGFCTYRYKIMYRGSRIDGPHDSSLTLIQDGLRLGAVIRNVEIDLEETNLSLDVSVDVSSLTASMDATLDLHNGRPRLQVRPSTVSVTSGNIVVGLTGWGWLDNILSSLVQGTLRSTVEDEVESFLKTQVNSTLDDLMSGLDISGLGNSFDIPRLDGNGSLSLDFGVNFSSLGVNATRALFGLGTVFEPANTTRATPSLGVPMPQGQNLLTADPQRAISAGVHIGVLNHVLHALWRGGLFDAAVSDSAIGGTFPDGTVLDIQTGLPPVAALQGSDKVVLMLGAMRMSIVYPGLFDDPVDVRIGAVARSGVQLNGSDLSFQNIQLNELYFSPIGINLDADSRAVLESFLQDVLQNVIDTSLNNALPALPVPSFEIPTSLGTYGLPAGSDLGIVNPALGGTTTHFVLKGAFGVIP